MAHAGLLCGCQSWILLLRPARADHRVLPEIVGKRDEAELDPHFPVRPEAEPLEAVVELDVPEDGFGFDGTVAAVHHPAFAGEQLPCLSLEPVGHVVDLHGPPVRTAFVAHSPERASLAVPDFVTQN